MRDECIVASGNNHKVQVAGAVGVAVQAPEQPADGSVVRDRVGHGAHGLEPEAAGSVGGEDAAAVGVGAVGVLGVVVAGVIGLPDVNRSAGNGLALQVFERAAHQA